MNNNFHTGTFSGFAVEGRCKISSNYSHHGTGWLSDSGRFMAVLDDPNLIKKPDGFRKPADQIPPGYSSTQIAAVEYQLNPDCDDRLTQSIDGASLRKDDIDLLKNQRLRIVWNFLVGDHRPNFNDFALLQISGQPDQILFEAVLCQARQRDLRSKWASGWRITDWICPEDCRVSVKISVANGYQLNPGGNPAGSATLKDARRYPSGLMLDRIEIMGA